MAFHASGSLPAGGVTIAFKIMAIDGMGSAPFVASYNPVSKAWSPLRSTYDTSTGTVTAVVTHFSIWAVLRFIKSGIVAIVKGIVDSVIGPLKIAGPTPVCSGSDINIDVVPNDGTLRFCGGTVNSSTTLFKVANLLAFPLDVIVPNGASVVITPPDDVYSNIIQAVYSAIGRTGGWLVPAGSEAAVDLPLQAGETTHVDANLDGLAFAISAIVLAVDVLGAVETKLGTVVTPIWKAVSEGTCGAQLTNLLKTPPTLTFSGLGTLSNVGFSCAEAVLDLGALGFVTGVLSLLSSAFEIVVQAAFWAAEDGISGRAGGDHELTVSRVSAVPPTLGSAAWAAHILGAYPTGYGQVAPNVVNGTAGAGPTGAVSSIVWTNWGERVATGVGKTVYVTNLNLPISEDPVVSATIVAFDLGTCGSGPAYTAFTWYLPEYGQSFSTKDAFNACTGFPLNYTG